MHYLCGADRRATQTTEVTMEDSKNLIFRGVGEINSNSLLLVLHNEPILTVKPNGEILLNGVPTTDAQAVFDTLVRFGIELSKQYSNNSEVYAKRGNYAETWQDTLHP